MKRNRLPAYDSPAFAEKFHYNGSDLGARYQPGATSFRLWAPTADSVDLLIFQTGHEPESPRVLPMKRDQRGTWLLSVAGDLRNHYYRYRLVHHGQQEAVEAIDPYAVAVGANGNRAMIVKWEDTHPSGWERDRKPSFTEPTDAIIYEVHVRDFTIHASSGIKHKGGYRGLTERGARGPEGVKTGIDHLRELGVSHVHLLPVADFASVDELGAAKQYNWGYDPKNYNVPEGSYSTDPRDGRTRIHEFKEMVMALHRAGLRVVLDVVYNHTYHAQDSHLNHAVPGYYYRQNADGSFSNGSGCGNETASDRSMVRKMMVDSLLHWAKEYHVDGFRFDLMGLHDLETMKVIRKALDKVDPTILLYGEGWTGGDSPLDWKHRAMKPNVSALKRIAAFSDTMRDAIKGPVGDHHVGGFIQGHAGVEERLQIGIVASTRHPQVRYPKGDVWHGPWAREPGQCVSYNSCHDNHALWDKIMLTTPKRSEAERLRMNKLAAAITLTSQGISFLHAGEEMARTKKGVENSYNHPDSINAIDWRRKVKHAGLFAYYRGLIALRKAHPAFRMIKAADVRKHLAFLPMPAAGMVGYCISGQDVGDTAEWIVVLLNGSDKTQRVDLPESGWRVVVDDQRAGAKPFRRLAGASAEVAPHSALVLIR
ncbi:MAG TPA: type I pullulanase [Kiritimatiellia bacterium]|nr:type I pullulanase [Kiritimatiellia bacterium]HMO98327.1 type I pullulanase [Kiritimatiellia bacterium]